MAFPVFCCKNQNTDKINCIWIEVCIISLLFNEFFNNEGTICKYLLEIEMIQVHCTAVFSGIGRKWFIEKLLMLICKGLKVFLILGRIDRQTISLIILC